MGIRTPLGSISWTGSGTKDNIGLKFVIGPAAIFVIGSSVFLVIGSSVIVGIDVEAALS
jgi:hypothetical protein